MPENNVLLQDIPTSLNVDESFTALWTLFMPDKETLVSVAPDTVKLRVVNPAGIATEYILGSSSAVQTITSPHTYRTNIILDTQGTWDWKFIASWTTNPLTAGNIVVEGQIKVRSNRTQEFA